MLLVAESRVHYLVSWVDTDTKPVSWPPHPQLLGYWVDGEDTIGEEGKVTRTKVTLITALISAKVLSNGLSAVMDLLREVGWTPVRLRRVLTRQANWYPDTSSKYPKPLWADELGRFWPQPTEARTRAGQLPRRAGG